jgi:hypothetical protein
MHRNKLIKRRKVRLKQLKKHRKILKSAKVVDLEAALVPVLVLALVLEAMVQLLVNIEMRQKLLMVWVKQLVMQEALWLMEWQMPQKQFRS